MVKSTTFLPKTGLFFSNYLIIIYPLNNPLIQHKTIQFAAYVEQGYTPVIVRYVYIPFLM